MIYLENWKFENFGRRWEIKYSPQAFVGARLHPPLCFYFRPLSMKSNLLAKFLNGLLFSELQPLCILSYQGTNQFTKKKPQIHIFVKYFFSPVLSDCPISNVPLIGGIKSSVIMDITLSHFLWKSSRNYKKKTRLAVDFWHGILDNAPSHFLWNSSRISEIPIILFWFGLEILTSQHHTFFDNLREKPIKTIDLPLNGFPIYLCVCSLYN